MKVLSLFDGMSCGQIALRELGITPETYYASEIDRHAIAQTQYNFPDTVQLGDVTRWREWDIDWEHIDLVMGGSPCQGFSFAGKQLAFDDPRSRLFFVFADILAHARACNPGVKFLLENVNMKKEHMRVISQYVGVFPVNINSALVSAQNRNRWYWTDIRTRREGLFGDVYSDIPQPEDRGIVLRDILDTDVDEKYYLSEAAITRVLRKNYSHPKINPEKAGTINTKNNSGQASFDSGTTFISINGKAPAQRASTGRSYDKKHNYQFIRLDYDGNTRKEQDKSGCLTVGGHGAGNHSDMDLILQLPRGYNQGGIFTTKSPTLSSNAWEQNNLVVIGNIYDNGHNSQAGRVYDTAGKSTSLRGEAGGVGSKTGLYLTGARIRRLTPTECARLQTIPEWYRWDCSETQQYKMLGNGWTVEVIKHILSFGKWNNRLRAKTIRQ